MAHFGKDADNPPSPVHTIRIPATETVETYTIYIIEVTIGIYKWTVKHRYSDFHELHEKLCATCKIDKSLLPPKKIFGNQSEDFIKKRQSELQIYLRTVLYYVSHKIPSCLAAFLEFDLYEIHGITQVMAEDLYSRGDILLQTREMYRTTPLHLYSLTERLKLPEPTCDSGDVKRDIGHILDFITRLKCLEVCGGQKVGTSNIDVNLLPFDLTLFKSLQKLELLSCDVSLISGLDTVKQTMQTVIINKSMTSLRSFLLQDVPQWKADDGTLLVSYWDKVTCVDLSHNTINEIEDSIQLMPKVVKLNMSHNQISTIQNLHWLSYMTYLDLSHNALKQLEALHSKLGNLKTLNLAGNKLTSLQGVSKMFSLENLDISYNQIAQIDDIKCVSGLPCLEQFLVEGNPVTITLDYRTKTLALFGDRAKELVLDREKADQKELDTVAILQAIQKSKDKAKHINVKKASSSASLTDLSPSPSTSYSRLHGNGQSSVVGSVNNFSPSSPYTINDHSINSPSSAVSSPQAKDQHEQVIQLIQDRNLYSTPDSGHYSQTPERKYRISSSSYSSTTSPLPSGLLCVNISSLANHRNHDFTEQLHTRLFGKDNTTTTQEQINYVLWCPLIQYSNSSAVVQCCVVLTERRIFILQLKNKEILADGVPEMETFYIMPLCNIQQTVIGSAYSFVRLEESFVGAPGTFVLLCPDSDSGEEFFECLNLMSEKTSETEMFAVIDGSQNSDLSKQLFDYEKLKGECTGRIVYAAHVHVAESRALVYLIMSENRIYIVKSSVVFWPKPTFDPSDQETAPKFDIAQQFSVEGKISELHNYTVSWQDLARTDNQPPTTPTHNVKYAEFGLSMTFHELLGSHKFDFHFFNMKARDMFMERLTNLRSEHAHRASPTVRESPEGGNEEQKYSTPKIDSSAYIDTANASGSSESEAFAVSVSARRPDEMDSTDEILEASDTVDQLGNNAVQRKPRSKTEIIITRPSESEKENTELPSYTWHYLSLELINHLSVCVKDYSVLQTITPKLQSLVEMNGEEVARFFHTNIVPVGVEWEELHHIVWTSVIPYTSPTEELVTCVMLSNRAVYLVSDKHIKLQPASGQRPVWMTHSRHVSDSIISLQAKTMDRHHCSGILHSSESDGSIIKPYCILDFSEIQQINVGLFDQCVRLTGSKEETVFTLVTRNSETTSQFIKQMSTMLSLYVASPKLDKSSGELEQDFYKAFNKRTKTTVDGIEYVHPSKVKFCYPGDESIADLLYIINEHLKSIPLKVGRENILQYVLGFKMQSTANFYAPILLEPISIILTNECLCFVTEDLVRYPLPEFVRGLPGTPQQKVTDVKKIEYLNYVKQNENNPRDITLVFSDVKDDIVLVPDHYSLQRNNERDSPIEILVRLSIQSERELSKFLLLLGSQWKEKHQGVDKTLLVVKV